MDNQDLTVACVFWKGEFRNRPYREEWVRRLKRMAERHLPPHDFVCLSNVPVDGVRTISLTDDLPGWWSKIELFRPENGLTGRVAYLDLDTLIVGDMTDLVTCHLPTGMGFMPPSYTFVGGRPAGGDGVVDAYQTSFMVWDVPAGHDIYRSFSRDDMGRFRGDQDFIGATAPNHRVFPPRYFQKLKQCPLGAPPGVKLVLSMPWKNEEAAQKIDWVREIWC